MSSSTKTAALIHKDYLLEARNLGKSFHIYKRKRDRLKQLAWGQYRRYYEEFWAIRDINFSLKRGEAIGIVGKNGSGKSTLLQMICGTLQPSEGKVSSRGKIAALLELGSGFNSEFTGEENIYLNAALLGLSRKETEDKLDAILSFADIGDFAYQPVRVYSSGMVVRLAFAVIANVDADILVIDEALAVGDAFFTQKCMRFIQRQRDDNCLLFVSHDPTAVLSLCDRALLIERGQLQASGSAKSVLRTYMQSMQIEQSGHEQLVAEGNLSTQTDECIADTEASKLASIDHADTPWQDYRHSLLNKGVQANVLTITRFKESILQAESFGSGKSTIIDVSLFEYGRTAEPLSVGLGGELVTLQIKATASSRLRDVMAGFILKNDKGLTLLGDNSFNTAPVQSIPVLEVGECLIARFSFTLPLLPAGDYSFTACIATGDQSTHEFQHWLNDALIFRSECNTIAAGLAGVAMQDISVYLESCP